MTKKIHIQVKDNMVDAFVPGKPQDGGNLISDHGGKISWKHQASSLNSAFAVTFIDLETGHPGYPFIPHDSSLTLKVPPGPDKQVDLDRKSTRLNSSHSQISYAVFCLKKKKKNNKK